ncbi:hypothetical protein HCC61_03355 [Streptomyces sp. HNM0575]|uniref:hypothetical protein n=1 Tax=Streptomyces sp. HNM0575 TaxID=2716338 RepID=UPI00145DEEA4|nr:hypothetical protein [Streptomyces sp. HNM0575]NLU71732.1 hypothetical protein [Streptomyces sp. HNM0575]
MLRTGVAVGAALVVTCAFGVTPARSSPGPPTLAGPGFQVAARLGVTSVSPSRPYTVTFASDGLKQRYTPYLTAAVAQMRAAGVRIGIGGTESVDPGRCPPWGHIQYTQTYRPLNRGGYSRGMPCPGPAGGVAAGGIVTMDSEYFDGTWHIAPYQLRNTFVHEMLHTFGLDHPNRDLDGDGKAGAYECVTGPGGVRPVMCSPNGGYKSASSAGRLTPYDMAALRAMLANARRAG